MRPEPSSRMYWLLVAWVCTDAIYATIVTYQRQHQHIHRVSARVDEPGLFPCRPASSQHQGALELRLGAGG